MPESRKNAELLKKIRDRFKYCLTRWQDVRDEHDTDMRFLAGDQWLDVEKRDRKDKNRPMVVFDELTQYVNQLINDVRQNKREAKISPEGYGATAKSAELLENWARSVQYKSNANAAYITGFEQAAGASYGFWKLETFYENDASFNQSVRVVPIPNGNTVVFDPDCLYYDCSDAADCFEINFISHADFKEKWTNAEIREFTDEIRKEAPEWVKEGQVQIASYWKVEKETYELHLVKTSQGNIVMRDDELPEKLDKDNDILQTRECEKRRVVQTILNGVEILEVNDPEKGKGWPGKWIPIIPCWGKEIFVTEPTGSKRMLLSLIRMARDPQRLLNYYASQEQEEAKLTPKTPYMGPKGMFSDNLAEWQEINDVPKAYIEFNPMPEGEAPGYKPERVPFAPNFQQYELVKEAAKRAIQAAMGISPLPTAAQRQNEKSGVALQRIQGERQQGTYHLIDNFERSLECTGRQLVDVFTKIHDTEREVSVREANEKQKIVKVNDPQDPQSKVSGEHAVTIAAGPSFQSQREEAADFADTFTQHAPQLLPLVADLMVKSRQLGPLGDEMAKRLTPPQFANQDGEPLDPQAVQQLHQAAQQLAQAQAQVKQLTQIIQSKSVEVEGRKWVAALQEQTKLIVAQANLNPSGAEGILQVEQARIQAELEERQANLDRAHEVGMASHQAGLDMAVNAHQQGLDKDLASHQAAIAPEPEPAGANQ